MSDSAGKAVFLSYASQDAEAARRICESLRAGGVEVWFDSDGGLEHGDEWDAKIRRQIKECVLFIPVISASTQARHEGYFRIEWELAAQRALGIASGVPFILPVVIDDTRELEALVPDRFRMVQWTKLLGGVVTPEVQARYLKLWSHRTGVLSHEAARGALTTPGFPTGRGLAAVVFTDVVGYSSQMQRDETGTMALVKADFALMSERCAEHGGEVLNTMGDGLLMCFSSAVQAVTCALQIQSEFGRRRATKPPEQALEHRMGVHIGDVFRQETGGVAGDGVNIASRLEGKAPAGGVCISQMVYDTVKGKVPMQSVFIGPESFKNITEPIPVWHIAAEGDPAPARLALTAGTKRRRSWQAPALGAAAVGLVITSLWFASRKTAVPVASIPATVHDLQSGSIPFATPRLGAKSIGVLPFENQSEDGEASDFFAEGMHEDVITHLLNIRELRCVPRNTMMTYRNTKKSNREIAGELGVAHVLTGTVRRVGKKVRITGTLIDARTDESLWSRPYDKDISDLFAIQSELAQAIAAELKAALSPEEQRRVSTRPTENPEAYELYLRSRHEGLGGARGEEGAIAMLQAAVALDPGFAIGWAELAKNHGYYYSTNQDHTPDRLTKARLAIDNAVRLAPEEPEVILGLGRYYYYCFRDYHRATAEYEKVLRLQPHSLPARFALAAVQRRQGQWETSLTNFRSVAEVDQGDMENLLQIFLMSRGARRFAEARTAQREWENASRSLPAFGNLGVNQGDESLLAFLESGLIRAGAASSVEMAANRGNAAEVIRLDGIRPVIGRHEVLRVGVALATQGDLAGARSRLRELTGNVHALLKAQPDNDELWDFMGKIEAVGGDKAEALRCSRKAVTLRPVARDTWSGPEREAGLAFVCAWTDRKAEAVDLCARLLAMPVPYFFGPYPNVHVMKHSIWFAPLRGDPRFEALLADPKNNAPLF